GTAPAKKSAPKKPASSGSKMPLMVGGGVALVAIAGVMVWAMTRSNDEKPTNTTPQPIASAPKMNLNESARAEEPSATGSAKTEPAPSSPAPPATPTASTKSSKVIAGFAESPKSLPLEIPADVRERVKRSAVQIRCRSNEGSAEGSGWFAE